MYHSRVGYTLSLSQPTGGSSPSQNRGWDTSKSNVSLRLGSNTEGVKGSLEDLGPVEDVDPRPVRRKVGRDTESQGGTRGSFPLCTVAVIGRRTCRHTKIPKSDVSVSLPTSSTLIHLCLSVCVWCVRVLCLVWVHVCVRVSQEWVVWPEVDIRGRIVDKTTSRYTFSTVILYLSLLLKGCGRFQS